MKKNNFKHFLLLCGFLVEGFNQHLYAIKPSILFSKVHLQQQIRVLKGSHEVFLHHYNNFKTLSPEERKVFIKAITAFSCMHLGEKPLYSLKDGVMAAFKGARDFYKSSSFSNSDSAPKIK